MKPRRAWLWALPVAVLILCVTFVGTRSPDGLEAQSGGGSSSTAATRSLEQTKPSADVHITEPGRVELVKDAAQAVTKHWPKGRVRDERIEQLPDGRERWSQWIETDGPYPQVRADLVFENKSTGPVLVEETYYLANSVVVERPADVTVEQFAARVKSLGLKTGPQYGFSPAVRVFAAEPLSMDSVVETLQRLGAHAPEWKALPDHIAFSDSTPNDFNPRELWSLTRIGAPAAWEVSTGSSSLVVAVIDSGITFTHPDLAANIWQNPLESGNGIDDDGNGLLDDIRGWDFANNDNDPTDEESHGTHVAGIIGAVGNNGTGITGVSQRIKILALRTGNTSLSTSAVIQALDYVTNLKLRGVSIVAVNNSYTSTTPNSLQRDSIIRCRDADILFVASAGNDSRNIDQTGLLYPIGYNLTNIIGVASTNLGDTLSDFSNWGTTSVHIAAPGSAILSTVPGGLYAIKDGTSMSAPLVAGAAALLRAAEPTLGSTALKTRLIASARPLASLATRVSSGARLDLQTLVNPTASIPVLTPLAPIAEVHALESAAQTLLLSMRAARVSNGAEDGSIPVSWSKESGPGTVAFTPLGNDVVSATFSLAGLYKIVATATYGGLETHLDRTVVVGAGVVVPATQLLARWTFSEDSGAPLDSSGQGRNGVLIDGPTRDAGPSGTPALRFTGTLSTMKFAAPGPTQVTLAGWVRMDAAGNSIFPRMVNMPAYYLFLGRDVAGNADANIGSVKFLANWTGTDGVWHSPQNLVTNDVWYHVAATYDGTKGLRELPHLYLNGRELDVAAQTAPAGTVDLNTGDGYLGNNEERTRALLGRLSDMRIYGRPLGSEEIALLAREPILKDLGVWEVAVQSSSVSQVVVALRLPDGRLPGPTLTAVWQQISGPGAPTIVATNGTQATLGFTQNGPHTVIVDLYDSQVMLRRQVSLTLPGVVAPPVLPGFVRAPGDRTVAVGSSVTFEVEATGTPPLTYQWLRDGVPINGQILSRMLLTSLTKGDSGLYSVRVTNIAGSKTSGAATLTVLDPPAIVQQPVGTVVAAGTRVELSVSATGAPPLTYQWSRDNVVIPGATSPTLVVSSITAAQNGDYTVVVTNAVGTVTSSKATVEVLIAPSITSQPASQTILAGRTLVFDVQVSGTVPYTFAWFKDGVLLPNETLPTLRFTTLKLSDSGTYTFRVSNAVGSATTIPIVLSVVSAPVITRQPVTVAVVNGAPATFSVEATGTSPLTYQWQRNLGNIPGATSAQLAIPSVGLQDIGTYAVVITNEIGVARSDDAYLDIVPVPKVSQHPASVTVALGGAVTLDVVSPDPAATLFYRWWRNGTMIAGANSARLQIAAVTLADVGLYYAELTNSGGTSFSKPAVVAVTIPTKTSGTVATRPEWQDIVHPNGNSYDQFVLDGAAGAITADPGQVSRMSFIDPQNDIVQVELFGKGTLTVSLTNAVGPASPTLYDQPGVLYMQGQATVILADCDENTHVSVFSVGPANNPGAVKPGVTYEGWATLRALGVHATSGRVGGLRLGNGRFEATTGATGLWAAGVSSGTVFLSDIAAFASALPVLAASTTTEIGITGGGLFQPNSRAIITEGLSGIRMRQGSSSSGQQVGPSALLGRIERDGIDISNVIVLPSL